MIVPPNQMGHTSKGSAWVGTCARFEVTLEKPFGLSLLDLLVHEQLVRAQPAKPASYTYMLVRIHMYVGKAAVCVRICSSSAGTPAARSCSARQTCVIYVYVGKAAVCVRMCRSDRRQ